MSWSVTINDLDTIVELPRELIETIGKDNILYARDALFAFDLAKASGLVSATLSGGRTPSPYGGPDSVVISVVGFDSRKEGHAVPPSGRNFNLEMKRVIASGPDEYEDDYNQAWHAPYEGEE